MRKPPTPPVSSQQEKMPPPTAGTRSKRINTTFVPNLFAAKRRRTESFMTDEIKKLDCSQCKKKDKPEMLLNCKGNCSSKIHLSCLQSTYAHFGKNEEESWRCYSCQFCSICKKGVIKDTPLLKCYICFTYYHSKCHGAENKIQIVGKNRFRCDSCEKNDKTTKEKGIMKSTRVLRKKTVVLPKNHVKHVNVQVHVISNNNGNNSSEGEDFLGFNLRDMQRLPRINIRRSKSFESLVGRTSQKQQNGDNHSTSDDVTSILDASEWSTNEVYEYFKEKFPRHAHVFEEEEIDGRTLYLLKREDIMQRFKIKTGPSLRIYDHILKIQQKKC